MKKIFMLISLFFTCVFSFSLDLKIVNKYTAGEVLLNNSFSQIFYFKEVLFYFFSKDLLHVQGNKFVPIFNKEIREEFYNRRNASVTVYLSDDFCRLFYYSIEMYNQDYFFGYEIFVNHDDVSYTEKIKNNMDLYIKNSNMPNFIENKRDNELKNNYYLKIITPNLLLNNEQLDKYYYPQLFVFNKNGEVLYKISDLFENDYICNYTINQKKNKFAIILSDKHDYPSYQGIKTYVVEFSVVYDGVINDDQVRFRSEAGLGGEIRGHLNRGDKVNVIDRNDEQQRIDNMEDYWYLVKTENGQEGWMYGAYIDIEGE
jgi:hypothetical protein